MKKFKTVVASLCLTGLSLLSSCGPKDIIDSNIVNNIPPTAAAFSSIKETALENHTQNFQFDASDGSITLTSNKGVQININTNCLKLNGNSITGTVDLEYVELFDKGSMLITNKPTMGELPNGDKALLISGGEFFLEATQNGNLLDVTCGLQLVIPASLTGAADTQMTLWEGEIDSEDNLTWDEVVEVNGIPGVFVQGSQYYAFINNFGWTNVDRFYNDPRPKTQIQVKAPIGYNNLNSAVYLSYDGEDSGLAGLYTFDSALNVFSEHYGQIPIGLECHVIFATEDNGSWKYAIKPVTIVDNDIITFTTDETTTGTEATLTALINALP